MSDWSREDAPPNCKHQRPSERQRRVSCAQQPMQLLPLTRGNGQQVRGKPLREGGPGRSELAVLLTLTYLSALVSRPSLHRD